LVTIIKLNVCYVITYFSAYINTQNGWHLFDDAVVEKKDLPFDEKPGGTGMFATFS